jgi:hypothetical protein
MSEAALIMFVNAAKSFSLMCGAAFLAFLAVNSLLLIQ